MTHAPDLDVTLTPELFARLRTEALELDVPLEWLVASLIVDTIESGPVDLIEV